MPATFLIASGLFACASAPRVDLPAGTDPQPKISETAARIGDDQAKQYDQLSPSHFKDAQKALAEARRSSEKGEDSGKILGHVGEALAQLQMVEDNGQKSSATLTTVLAARSSAKAAKADTAVAGEFNSADEQLQAMGEDVESGDFHPDSAKISKLEGRYSDLELLALKNAHLGAARSLIDNAEKNGAADKAPETLGAAKVQYDSAARSIEANRHNPSAFRPAVAQSTKSARKLDQVLRTVVDSKTSETAAVQIYDQKQMLAANQASLQDADSRAKAAQNDADATARQVADKEQSDHQSILALQGQNQQYADKEALNQKIEKIKAEFDPSEAEVVRDTNKITIRLKTMKFMTAHYELTSTSLGTLQKVKEMISAVPVSKVVVEGHTDTVGTGPKNLELSQKRADAVRNYLVSEKTLPESEVEAKGYGYEKPLRTNKTKEGRAANRRVDVVIETTATL
jgi:outer membrane protein OmpA-like peptidoglycan-associated protein